MLRRSQIGFEDTRDVLMAEMMEALDMTEDEARERLREDMARRTQGTENANEESSLNGAVQKSRLNGRRQS